jgi:hypothetical protein
VTLAVAAFLVRLFFDFADDWMPNVATAALGLAGTITLVEWILRRERAERLKPRRELVLGRMGLDIRLFATTVAIDYAETHRATYEPIPATVLETLELWRDGHSSEDEQRSDVEGRGRLAPMMVLEAMSLREAITEARVRDRDVLEHDLIAAMDRFGWAVAQAVQMIDLAQASGRDGPKSRMVATQMIVDYFARLAIAFLEYGDAEWQEFPASGRAGVDAFHEKRWSDGRGSE